MKTGWVRRIKKIAKILFIAMGSLLLILFLLPYILPGTISTKIKSFVNKSIDGKVEFSRARLSFFRHFPSLTLSLYDFTSTGSAPYQNDKLLSAGELALGIGIPALFRGDIHINEFIIADATINVKVNEKGEANYNVYKSSSASTDTASSTADTTTRLQIEKIIISESNLVYDDLSSDILINAKGLNYVGKGDLSKAIFDLASNLEVDSFDFYYDREPYILNKKIKAELVTSINTHSLALEFRRNRMNINRLPLKFIGKFEFLSKGYQMHFEFTSLDAELDEVFSTVPPSYQDWLKKTRTKGKAELTASLSGKYITDTDTMPDLKFDMKIRDGYIAYEKAPTPLTNLYLDFRSVLPSLNPDSITVNIDSLSFKVDQGQFSTVTSIKGYEAPYIKTRTNANLDLEQLDKAVGFEAFNMKGNLSLKVNADGQYAEGQNPNRLRKDIIIRSIPAFHIQLLLRNGFVHFTQLPQPIQHLSFDLNADCPDRDYRHTSAAIENINFKALNNYLKGFVRLKNADNFPVDADLDGNINLADIKQFYPLDSIEINGTLALKIRSTGNYQPDKKIFPKTEASIKTENGFIRTKYYPAPIEKITVNANVHNKAGSLSDMKVEVEPITFEFEGSPFMIKADLSNFDNLQYDIQSKGEINLGKIYKVFSQQGWDVQGRIETDLSLKGNQADVMAQRYSRLNNQGTLKVNEIVVYSDLYPLPFIIDKGTFRFQQDQMKFEQFRTTYGKSTVTLDGGFSNLFNYIDGSGPLRGEVKLQSDYILLDELTAYRGDSLSARPDSLEAGSSGVIMIPADLDLKLTTDIRKAEYNKLNIDSIKGEMTLKDGELKLNGTGFQLAGGKTVMNGSYRSLNAARAAFTYNIKMDEFDVKRMYNEVELFRELAPAAEKAEGIISLDYNLEGKLGGDMYPIMPSLKGGGVLSIKNVKMKGFRFFNVMSKETGKTEIKDPDLNKIKFKTKIQNNVITLEKSKFKVAGFRLRVQGQTSFDGTIKFNCRLGLPPFGIIGIPMKVVGTGKQPIFKVGKTDSLPLKEQEEEMSDVDYLQ